MLCRTFELMIENARNELQQILRSASGITLFVPIDTALASVPSYNNLMTSQSLINKVRSDEDGDDSDDGDDDDDDSSDGNVGEDNDRSYRILLMSQFDEG